MAFAYAGAVVGSLAHDTDKGWLYWYPDQDWHELGIPDLLLETGTISEVEDLAYRFRRRRVVRLVGNEGEVWLAARANNGPLAAILGLGRGDVRA